MRMKRAGVRAVQKRVESQSFSSTMIGRLVSGTRQTPSSPSGTAPVARSLGAPGPSLMNSVDVAQPQIAPRLIAAAHSPPSNVPIPFLATFPTLADLREQPKFR